MLNVKDVGREKFDENEELTSIEKILGLERDKACRDAKSLRCGLVVIVTDRDQDGSRVEGPLMIFFFFALSGLLSCERDSCIAWLLLCLSLRVAVSFGRSFRGKSLRIGVRPMVVTTR